MIRQNIFRQIPSQKCIIRFLIILSGMLTVNLMSAQNPAIMENIPLHQRWLFPIPDIKTDTSLSTSSEEQNKNIGIHLKSEEHTSELQSRGHLVCRLLLEKKNIRLDTSCASLSNNFISRFLYLIEKRHY